VANVLRGATEWTWPYEKGSYAQLGRRKPVLAKTLLDIETVERPQFEALLA
jgi:hypothetical protein